mmetsp:Transcript_16063/g.34019  ORF Transcript_16063/g.34019 Transcript_16063/m.34019 type:complete len:352 (-) Transcript_16063:25-1080(-)
MLRVPVEAGFLLGLVDIEFHDASRLERYILVENKGFSLVLRACLLQCLLGLPANADMASFSMRFDSIPNQHVLAPDVEAYPFCANDAPHEATVVQTDPHVKLLMLDLDSYTGYRVQHGNGHVEHILALLVLVEHLLTRLVHNDVGVAYCTNLVHAEITGLLVELGKQSCHQGHSLLCRGGSAILGETNNVGKEERHVLVHVCKAQVSGLHLGEDLARQHAIQECANAPLLLANDPVVVQIQARVAEGCYYMGAHNEQGVGQAFEKQVVLLHVAVQEEDVNQDHRDNKPREDHRNDALGMQPTEMHQHHHEKRGFEDTPAACQFTTGEDIGGPRAHEASESSQGSDIGEGTM